MELMREDEEEGDTGQERYERDAEIQPVLAPLTSLFY